MSAAKAKTEKDEAGKSRAGKGLTGNVRRFRAKVESGVVALDTSEERYWTAIRIPFDAKKVWPEMQKFRVRGTISGFPFRTSLFFSKTLGPLMLVTKVMQKQAGLAPGAMAEMVMEPDLEDRSAAAPAELAKLLKADRAVKKWFERLNYSMRKYICDGVEARKTAESRVRCAEQWVECLMLAMDGEIETPPVLQMAFRRYPGAREGWETMTPIQRRNQLLAIFQVQSPEARARRAERSAAEAARKAGHAPERPRRDADWMAADKIDSGRYDVREMYGEDDDDAGRW